MRDEKSSMKDRHSPEEKMRENKGQQKNDDIDAHRQRKAKRKNFSNTEIQDTEDLDESQGKPDNQYCCVRNTSIKETYLGRQDVADNDDAKTNNEVLCDTQKSQSDENQKKKQLELLSNLNIDDSDSPPKLTRMDEDEDKGFEGKV